MRKPLIKSRIEIEAAHAILGQALELGIGTSCPTVCSAMTAAMSVLCWVLHGNDLFETNMEQTAKELNTMLSPEGLLAKLPTRGVQ